MIRKLKVRKMRSREDGMFRSRIESSNGKIMFDSAEGYKTRRARNNALETVIEKIQKGEFDMLDVND